ncbi:MAG: hypothetical protein K2O99_09675 [Lachnospiraceae bacterium]|nr:hypothetical protein [Lachnospiraceae bacterium]
MTEEQINNLINAETWKTGEEWQEYFDIEVSEANNATACVSSYYKCYKNLPGKLEPLMNTADSKQPEIDIDRIADALASRIEKTLTENRVSESDTDKKTQIDAILEDLDLI